LERQENKLAVRVRVLILKLGDDGGSLGRRPRRDIDLGITLVEDIGKFFAEAAGATRDDEDLEMVRRT